MVIYLFIVERTDRDILREKEWNEQGISVRSVERIIRSLMSHDCDLLDNCIVVCFNNE